MDRFNRIFDLHKILSSARYPVPRSVIQERLECSRATFTRIVVAMRDFLGAPVEYDRERNGYYYAPSGERPYELPGLWFNASEIHALLVCQELLTNAQPGLLDETLAPLRQRISALLTSKKLTKGEVGRRIRVLKIAYRAPDAAIFRKAATATLERRRLWIAYHGRARGVATEREVSPQRMVNYRDNWYLDGWCHLRHELRSFAMDRIKDAHPRAGKAKEIPNDILNRHFAESYGIFAGEPKETAVLLFSGDAAPWIAREQWHPRQETRWVNGGYELRVPYSDPRELAGDILRHGESVTVVAPASLRRLIRQKLAEALLNYDDDHSHTRSTNRDR